MKNAAEVVNGTEDIQQIKDVGCWAYSGKIKSKLPTWITANGHLINIEAPLG